MMLLKSRREAFRSVRVACARSAATLPAPMASTSHARAPHVMRRRNCDATSGSGGGCGTAALTCAPMPARSALALHKSHVPAAGCG
jgi:hypothetical protein